MSSLLLNDDRAWVADVRVVNLVVIKVQIALQHEIHGRAARKLRFRAARQQHPGKSHSAPNPGANARAFATSGDAPDARSRDSPCRDLSGIRTFTAWASNLALGIRFSLGATLSVLFGAAFHIHGIAVRKNQSVQTQTKLAFPFHTAWSLCIAHFSAKIRTNRHDYFVIYGDWK